MPLKPTPPKQGDQMRTSQSITEIAAELERQTTARQDYIAPNPKIAMEPHVLGNINDVRLTGLNGSSVTIAPHAHGQIAAYTGIPKAYYDRMMAEAPSLLADNVNQWLHTAPHADEKRMIRTLDGRARAFLSPKFRPLDNYDLASAVLPVLQERKVQIVSSDLSDTRMYIKGILPDLSDEAPAGAQWGVGHVGVGDRRVVASITISNSEVGAGTLRIEPGAFITSCTNLMILAQAAMKKYHVGRAFTADESYEVFRDETRIADDKAFWMKVKDITLAAFDETVFKAAMDQIRKAAGVKIDSDALPRVVEVAVERLKLPTRTGNSILTHLARGGDLTAWGLSNAITATAESHKDLSYEEATQLERAGGEVITLSPTDWKAISTAA
jgi:tRNA pseudouridine-54 N-methylase